VGEPNTKNAIRIISGDPGSGKSSFTKMLAAELAGREMSVLRIPLHLLDLQKTWSDAVTAYIKKFVKLELDPLNPPGDKSTCLIIFDGLDELVQAGKEAEVLVTTFLDHVKRELITTNERQARIRVIISGRTYAIQSHETSFREKHQVLNLFPYHLQMKDDFKKTFGETALILDDDQRDEWWEKYGKLTGGTYRECPPDLKKGVIAELTGQPLLNHLLAKVYQEAGINFAEETNPNSIYREIINLVYRRESLGAKSRTLPFHRRKRNLLIGFWRISGFARGMEANGPL
jgi:hypothetical protein